jgi:hypothetical protein
MPTTEFPQQTGGPKAIEGEFKGRTGKERGRQLSTAPDIKSASQISTRRPCTARYRGHSAAISLLPVPRYRRWGCNRQGGNDDHPLVGTAGEHPPQPEPLWYCAKSCPDPQSPERRSPNLPMQARQWPQLELASLPQQLGVYASCPPLC